MRDRCKNITLATTSLRPVTNDDRQFKITHAHSTNLRLLSGKGPWNITLHSLRLVKGLSRLYRQVYIFSLCPLVPPLLNVIFYCHHERNNSYYFSGANQQKEGTKIYSVTQCSLTVEECDWHILGGNDERINSHYLTRNNGSITHSVTILNFNGGYNKHWLQTSRTLLSKDRTYHCLQNVRALAPDEIVSESLFTSLSLNTHYENVRRQQENLN